MDLGNGNRWGGAKTAWYDQGRDADSSSTALQLRKPTASMPRLRQSGLERSLVPASNQLVPSNDRASVLLEIEVDGKPISVNVRHDDEPARVLSEMAVQAEVGVEEFPSEIREEVKSAVLAATRMELIHTSSERDSRPHDEQLQAIAAHSRAAANDLRRAQRYQLEHRINIARSLTPASGLVRRIAIDTAKQNLRTQDSLDKTRTQLQNEIERRKQAEIRVERLKKQLRASRRMTQILGHDGIAPAEPVKAHGRFVQATAGDMSAVVQPPPASKAPSQHSSSPSLATRRLERDLEAERRISRKLRQELAELRTRTPSVPSGAAADSDYRVRHLERNLEAERLITTQLRQKVAKLRSETAMAEKTRPQTEVAGREAQLLEVELKRCLQEWDEERATYKGRIQALERQIQDLRTEMIQSRWKEASDMLD